MTNQYFSICGLFCIILLMIVFFCKKKINSIETKIYGVMLICSCIDVLLVMLEVSFGYMNLRSIPYELLKVLNKIDMIYYILWPTLLFLYMFYITYKDEKKYLKYRNLCCILDTIFIVIEFLLPINIINDNGKMGVDGTATNFVLAIATIYFIIILIIILKNLKTIKLKKCIPYAVLIMFMVLAIYLRNLSSTLIVIPAIMVYIDLIMYFTLENPDLKILKEFHKQRERAEESNKEKISFLFNLSNDIKEPILNIGRVSSNILLIDDINEIKEDVRIIKLTSTELLQLVDNVLDVSDLEKRKIGIRGRQYHVYNLFNTLNKLYEKTLNENIEYRFNYDYSIPEYLYGDSIRLKQIMNILLDNARDYTKEGFVEVNVNHIVKHDICRLIITVEDSGSGIHSEELEHLFDKEKIYSDETLKTIDDAKNNLGMLKSLVNLMNGSVMVNSEFGKGTKFTIVIDQRMKMEKTKVIEAVEKYEELYENKEKVLLVTDEKEIQKEMKKLLKKYDIELEIVEGGQNCLEKIRENKKYDMILIEEDLPKLSSEDTLFKLGELGIYKTPIIVLTIRKEFGVEEELIKKGFNDVIKLPLKKEDALKVIDKYLKK